jgi:transglutaminase-like putative cysteine protease
MAMYGALLGWAHPGWQGAKAYLVWGFLGYALTGGILSSLSHFTTILPSQLWMQHFFRSPPIAGTLDTFLRLYDYLSGREAPTIGVLLLLIFLLAASFRRIDRQGWGVWLFLPLVAYVVRWFLYDPIDQTALNLYVFGSFLFLLRDQKRWLGLLMTLAVFAMVNVLAFLWPYEWINQRVDALLPDVVSLRTEYSRPRLMLYRSAFESDNDLGGPVAHEGVLLFRVEGNVAGGYLRGRTYTDYRGHYWTNAHNLYRAGDFSGGRSEINYRVILEGLTTRTLFLPMSTKSTSLDADKVFVNDDGAAYYKYDDFEDKLTSYRVSGRFSAADAPEDMALYLALDEGVTDRTRELAQEIAGGATDPGEVMGRLTDHLRAAYPYTLEVPEVGDRLDFVDTFLFETQRGYCTYYASSLAVMGRSLGIPTRYVEGFLLPTDVTGAGYAVTDDRAHAWVEAYLPERGWTIFEATPAYAQPAFDARDREPVRLERSDALEERSREDALAGKEDLLAPDLPAGQTAPAEPSPLPWIVVGLPVVATGAWLFRRRRKVGQAAEIYIRWHALETYYRMTPEPTLRALFERGLYGPEPLGEEEWSEMHGLLASYREQFRHNNGTLRGLVNRLRTGVDLIHGTGKTGTAP